MQSTMNFSQINDLGQHLPLRGKVFFDGIVQEYCIHTAVRVDRTAKNSYDIICDVYELTIDTRF